jgi:hypothetical protein
MKNIIQFKFQLMKLEQIELEIEALLIARSKWTLMKQKLY